MSPDNDNDDDEDDDDDLLGDSMNATNTSTEA